MARKDSLDIIPHKAHGQSKSNFVRVAKKKGRFVNIRRSIKDLETYDNGNPAICLIFDLGGGKLAHDGLVVPPDSHADFIQQEGGGKLRRGCLFHLQAFDKALIKTIPPKPVPRDQVKDTVGCLLSTRVWLRAEYEPNGTNYHWRVRGAKRRRPREKDPVAVWFPLHSLLTSHIKNSEGEPRYIKKADQRPLPFCSLGYSERDFESLFKRWVNGETSERNVEFFLYAAEDLGGKPETKKGDRVARLQRKGARKSVRIDLEPLFAERLKKHQAKEQQEKEAAKKRAAQLAAKRKKPVTRVNMGDGYEAWLDPGLAQYREGSKIAIRFNKSTNNPWHRIRFAVINVTQGKSHRKLWFDIKKHSERHGGFQRHATFTFTEQGRHQILIEHLVNDGWIVSSLHLSVVSNHNAISLAEEGDLGNRKATHIEKAIKDAGTYRKVLVAAAEYRTGELGIQPTAEQHASDLKRIAGFDAFVERGTAFLEHHKNDLKNRIGPPISARGYHASDKRPLDPVQPLQVSFVRVSPSDTSKKYAFKLIDYSALPPPARDDGDFDDLSGVYPGEADTAYEAMRAAVALWGSKSAHPLGTVGVKVFSPWGDHLITAPSFNPTKLAAKWLDLVGTGAGVVGIVLMIAVPPLAPLASALIWTSIFTTSVAAGMNIIDRRMDGFADTGKDAFDVLTVVANVFTAGEAGAMARWAPKGFVKTIPARGKKALLFSLYGQLGADVTQGVLIADEFVDQFDELLKAKMSDSDRQDEMIKLLGRMIVHAGLFYVGWNANKQGLKGLNMKADARSKSVKAPKEKVDTRLESFGDRTKNSRENPLDATDNRPTVGAKKKAGDTGAKHEVDPKKSDDPPPKQEPEIKPKPKLNVLDAARKRIKKLAAQDTAVDFGVFSIEKRLLDAQVDDLFVRLHLSLPVDAHLSDILAHISRGARKEPREAAKFAAAMYDFPIGFTSKKKFKKKFEEDLKPDIDEPLVKGIDEGIPPNGKVLSEGEIAKVKELATHRAREDWSYRAAEAAFKDLQDAVKNNQGTDFLFSFHGHAGPSPGSDRIKAFEAGTLGAKAKELTGKFKGMSFAEIKAFMSDEHLANKILFFKKDNAESAIQGASGQNLDMPHLTYQYADGTTVRLKEFGDTRLRQGYAIEVEKDVTVQHSMDSAAFKVDDAGNAVPAKPAQVRQLYTPLSERSGTPYDNALAMADQHDLLVIDQQATLIDLLMRKGHQAPAGVSNPLPSMPPRPAPKPVN